MAHVFVLMLWMAEIPSNFVDKSLLLDWTRSMFRKYPETNMEPNIRWFGQDFPCSAGGHLFRYQVSTVGVSTILSQVPGHEAFGRHHETVSLQGG